MLIMLINNVNNVNWYIRKKDSLEAQMEKNIHVRFKALLNKISSVFSNSIQKKKSSLADKQHEKFLALELRGQFLELYVKPIANELHRKTPKGLKYLKEACSK